MRIMIWSPPYSEAVDDGTIATECNNHKFFGFRRVEEQLVSGVLLPDWCTMNSDMAATLDGFFSVGDLKS